MRVLILGIDGYLGWSLAMHLADQGYHVGGVDAFYRRQWVKGVGGGSAIPVWSMPDRLEELAKSDYQRSFWFEQGDITDRAFLYSAVNEFEPDTIVHLAECPSAAYSMLDADRACSVQYNNVIGSLNVLYAMHEIDPGIHLVKLGSMGEYGTPNLDIPEGFFEVEYRGRTDTLPFPRQAGSWYHLSKVHDSHNLLFACKTWGLRATDIMQGVVYGNRLEAIGDNDVLATRLDLDESFGTVINRFCCQATIEHPLTVYGDGSQTRGYLPLRDSMQCLALAIEHPPEDGEYRVFNQFMDTFSVLELAQMVAKAGEGVRIEQIDNPRIEQYNHYYNPDHQYLSDLGYKPSTDIEGDIRQMLKDLKPYKRRIEMFKEALRPSIQWSI